MPAGVKPLRCYYDPGYYLPLPEGHPFPMEKFPEAAALLQEETATIRLEGVTPCPRHKLTRVHTEAYLDSIAHHTLSSYDRHRLGLPADDRLLERCALETAGTLAAGRAALEDGMACNLAGGTHHAFANRGLGFCVLNDVAVAIATLRVTRPDLMVMVIDTDAHQGNGTHALLRDDPHSFTYSIHVGKNYPVIKEPGDCDVPLPRGVGNQEYLEHLEATLTPALLRFEPDLVFWIAGADNHHDDRFGQMALTTAGMQKRDRQVLTLCRNWEVPVAVLYGGGYNRTPGMTARLHANTIMEALRVSRESPLVDAS
jgi:acetoin utilization deacetylase AcuC-like enzyme